MKASILLVDDRRENLLALESILKDLGHDLVMADSGEEALLRVLEQDFALILLDVRMPGMDGFETATYIRQRERSRYTPIMFITASTTQAEEWAFKGYQHGAVDYILKPVSPQVLRAKVSVFIELFHKTEQLKRQADELKRSNAELEQFAYVASHDLREPLRTIAGFVQLLQQRYRGRLDPEADKYIGHVMQGVSRMQSLISDLLEFSRAGKRQAPLEAIEAAPILEQAIENLAGVIKESRAEIRHGPMPRVPADPVQLSQVFQNLIANAIKFRGDQPPVVEVGAELKGEEWVFFVRDNGIGIDPQDHGRIFEVFKRLHARERYPGTGVGLAICKKVIEGHGGRIWVESEAGRGSTFYFTLPAPAAEAMAGPSRAGPPPRPPAAGRPS